MSLNDLLKTVVDEGSICAEAAVLSAWGRGMGFVKGAAPAAVVKVKSAEQVAGIVKVARKTRTPLVPVSSGPPHFSGGTVPAGEGSLVVDLGGMNEIVQVDRENRVAMCQPGVTFEEMIRAVSERGLRLNMPLLPRAGKSVVASLLDRAPVTMPKYQWDIADPLTCVEVVFGTGEVFRTGAAAGPGSLQEQWQAGSFQKEAAGPSSASWYRIIQGGQGAMGIVTWASMRCEIAPKLASPFLVGAPRPEVLMDLMHWLVRRRLVNESFILNSVNLAAVSAEVFPDQYVKIKEGLPPWILFFNVAGYDYLPEERVRGQVQDITGIARRMGLTPVARLGAVSAADLLARVQAPCPEPHWKLRPRGGCRDVFFLSVRKHLPKLMDTMRACAGKFGYPAADMGVYLQPVAQGTAWHCEFSLFFDPGDAEVSGRVEKLELEAVNRLMDGGAFFSRPHGGSAGRVCRRDPSVAAALKKVKAIVDPDGILNPGRLCF